MGRNQAHCRADLLQGSLKARYPVVTPVRPGHAAPATPAEQHGVFETAVHADVLRGCRRGKEVAQIAAGGPVNGAAYPCFSDNAAIVQREAGTSRHHPGGGQDTWNPPRHLQAWSMIPRARFR